MGLFLIFVLVINQIKEFTVMRNFYNELETLRIEVVKEIKERLKTLPLVDNLRKFKLHGNIEYDYDLGYVCMKDDMYNIYLTPMDEIQSDIEVDIYDISIDDTIFILDMLRDMED